MRDFNCTLTEKKSGKYEIHIKIPEISNDLIEIIRHAARNIGIKKIAIVGGVVRDLLYANHFNSVKPLFQDIDIVLEGSPIKLANKLIEELGSSHLQITRDNRSYQTVEMNIFGLKIDLACARKEMYASPGENPEVQPTSIEEDLNRRDFAINAIALDLSTNKLIDPLDGYDQLKKLKLSFIHSKSVEEDPTRIVRGARYAARFNLKISKNSRNQITNTINSWPWLIQQENSLGDIPPSLGVRLRMEMNTLLKSEDWRKALTNMQNWGSMVLFDEVLQKDTQWEKRLSLSSKFNIDPLTAFIAGTPSSLIIARRLQLPKREINLLEEYRIFLTSFTKALEEKKYLHWKPSHWCEVIESQKSPKEVIGIAICLEHPLSEKFKDWYENWQFIKSPTSAKELIKKGWVPGPSISEELNRQRKNLLDTNY